MTNLRIKYRKLVGPFLWLVVVFTSTVSYAQPPAGEVPSDDGITSYLFSPGTITVLLVLSLIAQLVYRHRVKQSRRIAPAGLGSSIGHQPVMAEKKRYDRDEISMLLKASASSKNNGRTLEEAIRMTQVAHANLLDSKDAHLVVEENAAPEVEAEHQPVEFESEISEAESHYVDAEPQGFETESQSADAQSQNAEVKSDLVASESEVETISS